MTWEGSNGWVRDSTYLKTSKRKKNKFVHNNEQRSSTGSQSNDHRVFRTVEFFLKLLCQFVDCLLIGLIFDSSWSFLVSKTACLVWFSTDCFESLVAIVGVLLLLQIISLFRMFSFCGDLCANKEFLCVFLLQDIWCIWVQVMISAFCEMILKLVKNNNKGTSSEMWRIGKKCTTGVLKILFLCHLWTTSKL